MDISITLLWVLLIASIIWGIICLFRKGHRLEVIGLILFVPVLLSADINITAMSQKYQEALEASPIGKAAQQTATTNHKGNAEGDERHVAKVEMVAENAAGDRIDALRCFSDKESLIAVNDMGFECLEAYRLLSDPNAIIQYCAYD